MQAVGAHPSYSMHPINIIQSASQGTLFAYHTRGCSPFLEEFSSINGAETLLDHIKILG